MDMLERLELANYRNLNTGDGLALDPLTIFVGPNGSGKTNLIRVLQFLQDAWVKSGDESRGVSRFESAVDRWGSGGVLDKSVKSPAVVRVDAHFCLEAGYHHGFALELDIKDENSVSVRTETLRSWPKNGSFDQGFKYYDADIAGRNIVVSKRRDDLPNKTRFERVDLLPANELAAHSLQKWVEENGDEPARETPLFEGKRKLDDFLSKWAFYDASQMNIDAIRKATPEIGPGDRTVTPSGTNLALVLHNLSRDIDLDERIKQAMIELFPLTRSLRTNIVGRVSLTVEWYLKGLPKPIYLDEMSEGTVRMLCWAAILFSPEIPRLLVLLPARGEPSSGMDARACWVDT